MKLHVPHTGSMGLSIALLRISAVLCLTLICTQVVLTTPMNPFSTQVFEIVEEETKRQGEASEDSGAEHESPLPYPEEIDTRFWYFHINSNLSLNPIPIQNVKREISTPPPELLR